MEKTFQFVDSTQVDEVTRKLMRSHVMKGKNAGKTIHRRSRLELTAARTQSDRSRASSREETTVARSTGKMESVPRNLGHVLYTFRFPVELTEGSLKTIDQFFIFITEKMYPLQLGLACNEYKYDWLREMFPDENASYCSLALMLSTNEFFMTGGVGSPKALSYLSHTLALVKKRIETERVLSDSTLSMVMMLILQEQIRHGKESRIHYEGLRKMIELRGGLPKLDGNPALLLKLSKMDILYTLQHRKQIVFYRDRLASVRDTLAQKDLDFDTNRSSEGRNQSGIDPYLQHIFDDAMGLTLLLNKQSRSQSLDLSTFLEIVTSICCRLIKFRPLQTASSGCRLESAYQIGLLVFMTTLFLQWDNRRIREYESISRQLEDVLRDSADSCDAHSLLWVSFMASLWFSTTDSAWITVKIEIMSRHLGIRMWSEARAVLDDFPWISALHDPTGQTTWDLVQAGLES